MILIKKEQFLDMMQTVEDYWDWDSQLYDLGVEIDSVPLTRMLSDFIDALKILVNDKDDMIEYYCWELEFGKRWQPRMVIDSNGEDIPVASAEDLWNYLEKENEV
jgi:hypothetical protein